MAILSAIVLFLSGIGAGVMTGLIGASAVTFMAGILIVILGYSVYDAIGISLMTDVFASLASAHIYKKYSNLDLKRAVIIGVFATIFAFLGSILARTIPDLALGDGLGVVILITGLSFMRNPLKRQDTWIFNYFKNKKTLASILIGVIVGLICGVFGVGGGLSILVALVFILGYPIRVAIGTSVLIMAFIALSGGIGHFIHRPFPLTDIIITSFGGIIGAVVASKYVNKISEERMFKISGIILIILAFVVIFKKFFMVSTLAMFGF
ncbi:MAG: sulfite exporter TauE/SafE family protein [Nanoarchaeota archaeon]|jgi:uncharacterized membrane protein YfcA|nr:sulfite exporter TauE/SafE family protein [Nanoarchaeota archaeon]